MKKEGQHQERRTHLDTKYAQRKMRDIIKCKIKYTSALSENERSIWDDLVADSFMSVGSLVHVYYQLPTIRIDFGTVHTFALFFTDWGESIDYEYRKHVYVFNIVELWKVLYYYCLRVFPYALADALNKSKESDIRGDAGSFVFNSKTTFE